VTFYQITFTATFLTVKDSDIRLYFLEVEVRTADMLYQDPWLAAKGLRLFGQIRVVVNVCGTCNRNRYSIWGFYWPVNYHNESNFVPFSTSHIRAWRLSQDSWF